MPVIRARLPLFSGKEGTEAFSLARRDAVLEEPGIRRLDPPAKLDLVVPAGRVKTAYIEKLPRGTIGLGSVEHDPRLGVNDLADQLCERLDAEVLARADVDVLEL